MGSIYAYSNSKGKRLYRIIYRRPDNTQTQERGFPTKREAENRLAEIKIAKSRGTYISPTEGLIRVQQVGEQWLAQKKGILKPSSYKSLETAWRIHVQPMWGNRQISSLLFSEIQTWVSEFDRSATVVARAFGVLAGILDLAERDRRIALNPARGVTLPRKTTQKERRYLTHKELWDVANNSGRHKNLVLTLGYCGLRWGEAICLRKKDVDFTTRRISVTRNAVEVLNDFHIGSPKTHEARSVPIPQAVADLLQEQCKHLEDDDIIFHNGYGGFMKRVRASKNNSSWWLTALKKARVKRMVLHDLRHTAASLAVSSGANVKAVQRMLGHASAAMTLDTYSDLFDEDLDALLERLDSAINISNVANMLPIAESG